MLAPSTVPGEKLPTSQRKGLDRNKDVWKCRSSRQGKDFLTCIQYTTDWLSNLHDPDQISRGMTTFTEKNGSQGTIFPLKISVRGTQTFRTKIPAKIPVHCTRDNAASAELRCHVHLLDMYINKFHPSVGSDQEAVYLYPLQKKHNFNNAVVFKCSYWKQYLVCKVEEHVP